jgi:hypothetical protein
VQEFLQEISQNQIPKLKQAVSHLDPRLIEVIDFSLVLMTPDHNQRALKLQNFVADHTESDLFKNFEMNHGKYNIIQNLEAILSQNKSPSFLCQQLFL